ncbi:thioredoxin-like protein [Dipodascopsis uninucleata]
MSKYQEEVKSLVESNTVMVFSKSYCKHAKATLDAEGVKHTDIELDEVDGGSAIQNAIYEITGQRTVPAIFIGGKFVGGNSDLQALKQRGELKPLLVAAGAA